MLKKRNTEILKIYKKYKKIIIIFIAGLLFLLWLLLSYAFHSQVSFSSLIYSDISSNNDPGSLQKGEIFKGEIKSKENYLGSIFISFEEIPKVDYFGEDSIQFRVKEKGNENWHYLNNYRAGLISSSLVFPFGFPPISESKDKTYEYELESINGNNQNSVKLGSSVKILTIHSFPEKEIFGSKKRILNYLAIKTINSITSLEYIYASLIFALPLFIFVIWLIVPWKKEYAKKIGTATIFGLILFDIFILNSYFIGLYSILVACWILVIYLSKLNSKINLKISLSLLIVWLVLSVLEKNDYLLKLNIWVFTFLFIGIFQIIINELNLNNKIRNNLKKIFK